MNKQVKEENNQPDKSNSKSKISERLELKFWNEMRNVNPRNDRMEIYAEKIRISPIRDEIRRSIANIMDVDVSQISVKATTWEKMGFVGREEAIVCEAVCLVSND
jgi:2-C-methyl-D-erythritol 2,4-cyclodiphosphate synthase